MSKTPKSGFGAAGDSSSEGAEGNHARLCWR
jgi:hypothetical protein